MALSGLRTPVVVAPSAVREARRMLFLAAATVTTVDLVDKTVSPTLREAFHPRPPQVVAVMVVVTLLGAWTFPRTGSRAIAVAGGLMVGGGLANTVSLLFWGRGVPNPLVSYRLGVAFNLADLAVGVGFLLLVPSAVAFAVRHRRDVSAPL